MLKFVLVVVVIVLALWWLGRARRAPADRQAQHPSTTSAASGRGEAMLRCRHCGVHLPASDAVRDAAGQSYCSQEHRLAHAPHDDPT